MMNLNWGCLGFSVWDNARSASLCCSLSSAVMLTFAGRAGMDGRKTDPGKMFQVSQPGAKKKKSNARFLNFI